MYIEQIDESISYDIQKEGFRIDKKGLTHWLTSKKLINRNEDLLKFKDEKPWHKSGGETYSTIFSFETDKQKKQILVKALTTLNPEKSLIDWARRRNLLSRYKIPVSNWYWTEKATIFEPYYPAKVNNSTDFKFLLHIAYTLDTLGFNSLKFIDDILCTEKGIPYYIDFGFDLGEPSNVIKTDAKDILKLFYPYRIEDIEVFYNSQNI